MRIKKANDAMCVRDVTTEIENLIMENDFESALDMLTQLRDELRFWGWDRKCKDYTPTGKKQTKQKK